VEKLLEARKKFKSLEGNDYVFAISGEKQFHLPGSSTIRSIAKQANVEPIEAFTARKLRKYISTDMVWMNLDPHQKRLYVYHIHITLLSSRYFQFKMYPSFPTRLASQLGHVLSVHDDVYDENIRSDVSKLHKIPALLCAYEAGLTLDKPAAEVTDDGRKSY